MDGKAFQGLITLQEKNDFSRLVLTSGNDNLR